MDMDPAERGGVEWVSEFCPVKGSSHVTTCPASLTHPLIDCTHLVFLAGTVLVPYGPKCANVLFSGRYLTQTRGHVAHDGIFQA